MNKRFLTFFIFILLSGSIMSCSKVDPSLDISPSALDFGNEETRKEFVIQNKARDDGFFESGINTLKYTVDLDKYDWITVDTSAGENNGEMDILNVNINRSNLAPGNNEGIIKINSNGGNKSIAVIAEKKVEKITPIFPEPATQLKIGQMVDIEWSVTDGVSETVDISLFLNGSRVGVITKDYNFREEKSTKGKFQWEIDELNFTEGDGYVIRINDSKNKAVYGEVSPVNLSQPINELRVKNITTDHQFPNTVQFVFSLRDQNDHAVLIEPDKINWKEVKISENEEEIDYFESHAFMFAQNDFPLQVMLVLDFSESMYEGSSDIKQIVAGSGLLIDYLRDTHQIGVIEFHRPDKAPVILQPFTTYKKAAKEVIIRFAADKIYRDFSTCWDAVLKGLKQFPENPDPNIFKSIVLVSDGFDNSSVCKPEELIEVANSRNVHIYALGIGEVHDEGVLSGIAGNTGGTYVHAENINVLIDRFKQVVKDLFGQYKISYITPKKAEDGNFGVKINITHGGVTSFPSLEDEIDPSTITGETIKGVINFTSSTVIEDQKAEIFMWCEHVPRYINEFHFKLDITKPYKVLLTKASDGGVCEGWTIVEDVNGWFFIISPNQAEPHYDLEFGNFGTICKIIVDEVGNGGLSIPFKLDNSIYDMGQSFYGGKKSDVDSQGDWSTKINAGSYLK